MVGLNHRAKRILYAAITEYIGTGEPVGSRKIARGYGIDLSPATIRNVLADLEETGYLRQPHTSAGRIPTDQGFRIFVDALVQMRAVSSGERRQIVEQLMSLEPGCDVLLRTGEILSALTGAAAIVVAPKPEEEKLARLHFLPLQEGSLLAVLVTTSGAVQNRVVHPKRMPEAGQLEPINNRLAELLRQPQSLVEVRSALQEESDERQEQVEALDRATCDVINAAVEEPAAAELHIKGHNRLFDRPEFIDPSKIRAYLKALEDQQRLLSLLDDTLHASGVRVLIGAEANLGEVDDVSVISATYTRSGGSRGAVGVIGPARTDYGKVVPMVEFIAGAISEALDGDPPRG